MSHAVVGWSLVLLAGVVSSGCSEEPPLPNERAAFDGELSLVITDGDRETRIEGRLSFRRDPKWIELRFADGTSWIADASGVTTGTVGERNPLIDPVELGRYALLEKILFATPSPESISVREDERTVYLDGPVRTEIRFRDNSGS